ncbi:MAG: TRAFs-binding domain-containing protein [Vicinamibacterales bacterium]
MANENLTPKPVCFMVMPFRKRTIDGPTQPGAPAELDCDALWDRVYRPVIEKLGYLPVRADSETGTVIVKDMLERLAFADLVLADVSLPNGNVYYEIGLRHVAVETGCVLLAATWSKQLFDIDQFRTVRFPLVDGTVPDAEAEKIRTHLLTQIPKMRDSATPWHEFITGDEEQRRASRFRDQSEATSQLQSRMGAARLADASERAAKVQSILGDVNEATLTIPEVVIELLVLVRDSVGWAAVIDFVQTLPGSTRQLPFVQEQRLLALAETGQPKEAIASLETLVANHGDSPERQGLIGGRYKRLWKAARTSREAAGALTPSVDERQWLNKAIECYSRGMELDFNAYYCSSNLPLLLIARGRSADVARAAVVENFVVAACTRALARGEHDEWLRPTLLGSAFRARDVEKANDLADRIEEEGGAAWKLKSTLADLRTAVQQAEGHASRDDLAAILERLEAL